MNNNEDFSHLMYQVFQNDPSGQKIFEYLTSRFYDVPLYTKGDTSDSIYKLGQRDVILHIIRTMAKSQVAHIEEGDEDGI